MSATREYREADQAAVFGRLRGRLLVNGLRQFAATSAVRLVTILLSSLVVFGSMLYVTFWGFDSLLNRNIPMAGDIIGMLFDLMFFALGAMLVFSSGIILYASLFTAPEAKFLLTTPAKPDHIFASKFRSAVTFASWGFLILGSPVLVSYGIVYDVPWYFYLVLPLFFLGFVILPGAAGGLAAVLLVNFFPNRRLEAFIGLTLVLIAVGAYWGYQTLIAARDSLDSSENIGGLIGQFALARSPWVPSHWASRGVRALARGEVVNTLYDLTLLWSNALFVYVIATFAAGRLYRRGFNRMTSSGHTRRAYKASWLDRVMGGLVFYLDRQTRLLILKDFRTFRRDPPQWVQIGIFVGLFLLYGFNARYFYSSDINESFRSFLSVVNIGAICLLMCTFLVRFIYPQISLEGRKFWILGLLPLRRDKLIWGKFAFAFTGAALIGTLMVCVSDLVLGMPPSAFLFHAAAVWMVAAGLTGLSVGISAWMPNFRETDPSRIVLGFGGTLNTVIGLGYLVLTVALATGPYHAHLARRSFGGDGWPLWVFAGLPGAALVTAAAVYIPMAKGIRTLRRMEF